MEWSAHLPIVRGGGVTKNIMLLQSKQSKHDRQTNFVFEFL